MNDTTSDIAKLQLEIIYKMTVEERFKIGVEIINFGRELVISSIKKMNPGISEIDLKIAVFKRYYECFCSPQELELIIQSFKNYMTKK
jgi:hypothetical protein